MKKNINLIAGASSLVLVLFVLLLNSFRWDFFGISKGNAAQEFGYLMTVSIPLLVIAFGLSLFVAIRELHHSLINRNQWKAKDIFTLLLTLPALIIGIFLLFVVGSII